MERQALELRASAALEMRKRKSSRKTVFGIVCPKIGFLRAITKVGSEWVESIDDPDIYIAKKLEPVLRSIKRFIIVIGGRGSTKSVGVADICIADSKDNGAKTYCLREFQSSIKNSVHSLIKEEINRFGFDGFEVLNQSIGYKGSEAFEFAGLSRNIDSVKSTHGFKRFTVEEAQFISQSSLDALTPTIREKPKNGLPKKFKSEEEIINNLSENPDLDKVSIVFIANPGSSEDPFSKRFIEPFKEQLDRDGIYEDDLHLFVMINYDDNPWYDDSGLDSERAWDKEHRSRAYYDHRWHGEYNDSVDDAIILAEWFDAAVDAHLKLNIKPRGQKVLTHDPSDTGDARAYVLRHGILVQDAKENLHDDVNDACDWALDAAISNNVDVFRWDADGLGLSLRRQVNVSLDGKRIKWDEFHGGGELEDKNSIYQPVDGGSRYQNRKVKDIFRNPRSQNAWRLRDRFYLTYRAVVHGDRSIPVEQLISISSDIECLSKMRSETCRIPLKNSGTGLIQIMGKDEMLAKHKITSPNLFDCLMMSEANPMKVINEAFLKPINYNTKGIV